MPEDQEIVEKQFSLATKPSAGLQASLVWPWLVGVAMLIMGGVFWVRKRLNTRGNFK